MSFRYHKSPSVVTLFHDPSSSASKQVLQLLTAYNAAQTNPHRPTPSSASNGESCIVEANGGGADVNAYLRAAASDPPRSPLIQLEIVDRKTNPPTPDQMRSIVDYLVSDPSPTSPLGEEKARYTASGFDLREHERRKLALKKHLADEKGGGMPKIKDGPLVVNWDEGVAATDVEGVKEMLERLKREAEEEKGREKDGGGCVVC
ncbi:Thioredoxin-like fold [Kalmanozyma brasiliensis GHG001]|uniref:Uncharacterized protein n=1 Tax=Kalmanozyma brasiliensis (strain GHG001) TaxID=1365824 RepID=V5EUU6_KALBG|nr:Thioredoxin-like fold [Kalmanozyma brasiliensis GHG001]EST09165.1 Thioredoxin-like fold [Kalmanozyma brasiliensis GHG001]